MRPKYGTATAIHIQDPDANTLELRWYPQDAGASANPAERATPLSALPAPVRDIWHVIGRPRHARHISRVRAA
ncbi:hypothetical protein ACFZCY_34320 [Streptomyces sp. NPDC007983]|uniref:hypothetical protein n=1 Tax=Streptomyces sp. NPDC007983 TaxID=3364800 RepID=UPI0036EF80B7